MSEQSTLKQEAFTVLPYVVAGVFFLLVALLLQMPASVLGRWLPPASPVPVKAWGGTVWHGQAEIEQGAGSLQLDWQLRPLALLAGRVQLDLTASGAAPLRGSLVRSPRVWQLQSLQGELPGSVIQPLLPRGWDLPGSVLANGLTVARQGLRQGDWLLAEGNLRWEGGPMQFNLNGQPKQATLPALTLVPQLQGQNLVLGLNEAAGSLADVTLMADGQMETRLRERLLRYSPDYRSSGMDPNAVVVTAKQAL